MTIIIIENDSKIRNTIKRVLAAEKHSMIYATNAEVACDIFETTKVDLAILDMVLPDMSGLSLLKKLKGDLPTSELPIIAVSANSAKEDIVEAVKLGVKGFFVAPINSRALLLKVKELAAKVVPVLRDPAGMAASIDAELSELRELIIAFHKSTGQKLHYAEKEFLAGKITPMLLFFRELCASAERFNCDSLLRASQKGAKNFEKAKKSAQESYFRYVKLELDALQETLKNLC